MNHSLRSVIMLVAVMVIGAANPRAFAATAEEEYAFARHLDESGDDAFALLEYKRFIYHNPDHAQAFEASKSVARLYISYLGDVDKAVRTMRNVAAKNPNTETAKKAEQYIEFF